jgi:hypothetical protein
MEQVLLWNIRTSFLRYLGHSGPHQIAGERVSENGPFVFVEALGGEANQRCFLGLIDIVAHGGLLRLTLKDPVLRTEGEGKATLWFDVGDHATPIELLSLSQANPMRWNAELTVDGSTVFDQVYPPGVPMADVLIEDPPVVDQANASS